MTLYISGAHRSGVAPLEIFQNSLLIEFRRALVGWKRSVSGGDAAGLARLWLLNHPTWNSREATYKEYKFAHRVITLLATLDGVDSKPEPFDPQKRLPDLIVLAEKVQADPNYEPNDEEKQLIEDFVNHMKPLLEAFQAFIQQLAEALVEMLKPLVQQINEIQAANTKATLRRQIIAEVAPYREPVIPPTSVDPNFRRPLRNYPA